MISRSRCNISNCSFNFINISSIAKSLDNLYLSYDNQIIDYNNNNNNSTLNNITEIIVSYDNDFLLAIGTESLTSFDLNNFLNSKVSRSPQQKTPLNGSV